MSKRDDIMRIWQESFADSRDYVRMYFDRVYRDNEAITLEDATGATVSSLLLQHYAMTFHGSELPVSYVAGAATRRNQRGKGYMSRLMADALRASADRGDALCALIPSRSALYYFYRRFGFSTVFYTKEQRFTSLHAFPVEGIYEEVAEPLSDEVWEAFDRFQRARECYIIHSRRDLDNIRADLDADSGSFVVMSADHEDHGPRIVSMAWGVPRGDILLVTDVMGESRDARTAALRALRGRYPDVPFLLYGHPSDSMGGRLIPRGMARVVNASLLLGAVSAAYPKMHMVVRVSDALLPDVNSHTFILDSGRCVTDDTCTLRPDLDVTAEVLAEIAFSSPRIGDILRFPSVRPMISLMLD